MEWSAVILAIFVGLVVAETYRWLPHIAMRVLRFHASRLPTALQDRLYEEWISVTETIPGNSESFSLPLTFGVQFRV